jgi:CRISPR system Cascade subunit CasD
MPTLLMRLTAPLQAYGTLSLWEERATAPRPTKSAVAGLVANALGWELDADLTPLRELVFATRADRPGHLMKDDQSAGGGDFPCPPDAAVQAGARAGLWYGAPRSPMPGPDGQFDAGWKPGERSPVLITKQYVADAGFLAGLSSPDRQLLDDLLAALQSPRRTLYLGRRSCPPAHPIAHGITHHGPHEWAKHVPLLPEATTATPHAWTEVPPEPGSITSPEQLPTTFALRDHRVLHLRATRTSPPPAAPESRP